MMVLPQGVATIAAILVLLTSQLMLHAHVCIYGCNNLYIRNYAVSNDISHCYVVNNTAFP